MRKRAEFPKILSSKIQLGPYPMEKLKRVEQPTTKITGNIERFDAREHGFSKALRGDFGPVVAENMMRIFAGRKEPVGDSLFASILSLPFPEIPQDLPPEPMEPPTTPIETDSESPTMSIHALPPEIMLKNMYPVNPHKPSITDDVEVMSRHIKSAGYHLGAAVMGICRLPQWAVYTHDEGGNPVELNHQFAIVIAADQGYRTMLGSSGHDWISNAQSATGYFRSASIADFLARYIRKLGYPTRAHSARHYQLLITPLLLLAGIGEMSRAGIVLNPFIGSRFKAAAVTTDMPLVPDKPVDFGLQDFCRKCKKCAIACPSQAIPMGDTVMHNGYENWVFDAERCTKYRITNPDGAFCGSCIKACPWNKPEGWTHDWVRWMVQHTPALNRLIVKMDDVWGYGKANIDYKWWFDLEGVDGGYEIHQK